MNFFKHILIGLPILAVGYGLIYLYIKWPLVFAWFGVLLAAWAIGGMVYPRSKD